MGCKNSTGNNRGELFNEDVDIKHKFLAGIQISKGAEGLEGNVQIALGTMRKKKYEMVPNEQTQTPVEENVSNVQDALEST